MKTTELKIAFGGGCHWCTEAVFLSLKGISEVAQGFVASENEASAFSEAVVITYNPKVIPLEVLITIHLNTHKSTSNHSMRNKYRSAVYIFSEEDRKLVNTILQKLQSQFFEQLITKVYSFKAFKPSDEMFQNYYFNNPKKPFCETYIKPKLSLLLKEYGNYVSNTGLED